MPFFTNPLANLDTWELSLEAMTIAKETKFRYARYELPAIRATAPSAENIMCPTRAIMRKFPEIIDDTTMVLEMQTAPFLLPFATSALPGGLPTFYMQFQDQANLGSIVDHKLYEPGDAIRTTDNVLIGIMGQDRFRRDWLLWSQLFLDAMSSGGDNTAGWQSFHNKLNVDFGGNTEAVYILDSAGQPVESATISLSYTPGGGGTSSHTANMIVADGGDLQATIARMNAANPATMPISNLWGTASSFDITPEDGDSHDFQMACLEDGTVGEGTITITESRRHIQMINLYSWIADQFASPSGSDSPALDRFTRNNLLTPFINGKDFFQDFFTALSTSSGNGNGLHHTGWHISTDNRLIDLSDSPPAGLRDTLRNALIYIGENDGKACIMPTQFIQLEEDVPIDDLGVIVFLTLYLSLATAIAFIDNDVEILSIDFGRTDTPGHGIAIVLIFSTIVIPLVVALAGEDILDALDESDDVGDLDSLSNVKSPGSPNPVTVDDNPAATTNDLLDIGLSFSKHVGVHHQKCSVIRNTEGFQAYCGGIDLNPNRIDDEHHMAKGPYHDVHAKITGPAVKDFATSFEERWLFDGNESGDLAFSVPPIDSLPTSGTDIIQVARTYAKALSPSRAYDFASEGDRTIIDSILTGINSAREFIYIEDQYLTPSLEYRNALLIKVTDKSIKKLIIVVPNATDQPFGDLNRSGFINDLQEADEDKNIVQVYFPQRHYVTADNSARTASGKLSLEADIGIDDMDISGKELISLGPLPRLPKPPFFLSVEGEIMFAYGMEGPPVSSVDRENRDGNRQYKVKRGTDIVHIKTERKEHKAGAAVTVINFHGIYIHSKLMIVDDVFLSMGSANLNRRGFYHDSEMNLFSVPQGLRTNPTNPILNLRMELWADMLNLPRSNSKSILMDPVAATDLFSRPFEEGNRMIDLLNSDPADLLTADLAIGGWGDFLLNALFLTAALPDFTFEKFFNAVVDPTTDLDPDAAP